MFGNDAWAIIMIRAVILEAMNGTGKWYKDRRLSGEPNIHAKVYRMITRFIFEKWVGLIQRSVFPPSAEAPAAASLGEHINDILAQRLGSPHIDMRDIGIVARKVEAIERGGKDFNRNNRRNIFLCVDQFDDVYIVGLRTHILILRRN